MQKRTYHRIFRDARRGFSIVELSVVLVMLAILVSIVGFSARNYQIIARDNERAADVEIITRALEHYYRTNAVATGPTYPTKDVEDDLDATAANDIHKIVGDEDALFAPDVSTADPNTTSFVAATTNAYQTPTVDQYIYQGLNLDGTICSTAPCVRYKIYYRLEGDNSIVVKDSMRQQ